MFLIKNGKASRIKTERSIQIKKHQIDISDNNSYYLQRKISIKKVPNNNSFSKTSKSNENSSFQVLNKILESEGKKKELKLEKQNKKQKITMLTDFYLDFLRKIELIKFSKSKEKGNQYIEIENLKILEENDLGIYNFINSNFGRDYFGKKDIKI